MKKVRIKKTPRSGDQLDYGLVDRQVNYTGEGDANTNVKNTMGATSKDKANIEVEGGETVIGDINNDGFLEHFTFVGKRHSEGGMPVNIPEGSFIFSDTKKLRIKDKEVLSKVFGLTYKKGGYTPAEIAKRYEINKFMQTLKDEDADAISKRSADEMVKKNLEKLGMLALIQESMKGFPDGIPAIAESAALGMNPEMLSQMMPQSIQEKAEMGGQPQFQNGGGFDLKYSPQTVIYINGVPFKYESHEDAWGWGTGDIVTFRAQDGSKRYYKTNSEDLMQRIDSGNAVDLGYKGDRVNRAYVTSVPGKSYYDANQNTVAGKPFNKGTRFYANGKLYEVEDPYAAYSGYVAPKTEHDGFARTTTLGGNYQVPSLKVYEIGDDGKKKGNATIIDPSVVASAVRENTFDYYRAPKNNPSTGLPQGVYTVNIPGKDNYVYKYVNGKWMYGQKPAGNAYTTKGNAITDELFRGVVTDANSIRNLEEQTGLKNSSVSNSANTGNQSTSTTPRAQQNTQPRQNSQNNRPSAPAAPNYDWNWEMGGDVALPYYQDAGPVQTQQQPTSQTQQPPAGDQEVLVKSEVKNGVKLNYYKKGNVQIIRNADNNQILAIRDPQANTVTDYSSGLARTFNDKNQLIKVDAPDPTVDWKSTEWKGKYSESADAYEKLLNDPKNEKLRDAVYNEFRNVAKQTGNADLLNIPKEEAIKILLKGNRDNSIVQSVYDGNTSFLQNDAWDRDQGLKLVGPDGKPVSGRNVVYNATMQKLGLDPMNSRDRKAFQAIYQASERVARLPEYVETFNQAGFDTTPVGKGDQRATFTGEAISPVDDIYGNTTVGQIWKLKEKPPVPNKPKETISYYCVKAADGTKSVVGVAHKEGEAPTPPAGTIEAGPSKDEALVRAKCTDTPPPPSIPPKKKRDLWYLPDIINYAGAVTDDYNVYRPRQNKVDFTTPGYVLQDPTRQLAANQEQMSRYQDQVENTTDGNVGLATTLGASGEGFANAANVIGNVENTNRGIVNQVYSQNAQIENQERLTNEQYADAYVDDMARLGDRIDALDSQKKWRSIGAFNQGWKNYTTKKGFEQVLTPQWYQDPISGDWSFSGVGRNPDPNVPDTYIPAMPMAGTQGYDMSSMYNNNGSLYNQYLAKFMADGVGEAEAKRMALNAVNNQNTLMASAARSGNQTTPAANLLQQRIQSQGADPALSPYMQQFGGTIPMMGAISFFDAYDDDNK